MPRMNVFRVTGGTCHLDESSRKNLKIQENEDVVRLLYRISAAQSFHGSHCFGVLCTSTKKLLPHQSFLVASFVTLSPHLCWAHCRPSFHVCFVEWGLCFSSDFFFFNFLLDRPWCRWPRHAKTRTRNCTKPLVCPVAIACGIRYDILCCFPFSSPHPLWCRVCRTLTPCCCFLFHVVPVPLPFLWVTSSPPSCRRVPRNQNCTPVANRHRTPPKST